MGENDLSTIVCQFTPAVTKRIAAAVAAAHLLEDVTDVPSAEAAVAVNAELAKSVKAISEERLTFTRKLDAVKKRATDYEKEVVKSAVECIGAIDQALNDYRELLAQQQREREAAAAAKQAELAAEEEKNGVSEERATAPLVAAELAPMEAPKIPTMKVPKVLITDKAAIPEKYITINESAILKDLKAGIAVTGAELTYEEVLVRR